MTIRVWEGEPFQEGVETATDQDSRTLTYYITGTDEYDDAKTEFENFFSLTHDDLELQRYRLVQVGLEIWKVTANYGQFITQSHSYTVDTTGATLRLTHGFSERRYGPAGLDDSTVPPMDGALNVQDGRVEGHEKVVPSMSLTLRYQFDREWITDDYLDYMENLTGTVNQDPFGGRPAETLLFLGGRIDQPAKGDATIEYHFLSGRHLQGLQLGDVIDIEKKAHEYMWPIWETVDDATANKNRKKIVGVYVDEIAQVADWTDFFPEDPNP